MAAEPRSLLEPEPAESEENLFIPPPMFERGRSATTLLPTMMADAPLPPSGSTYSWRRSFLAGGVLGGLVVGVLSFHADITRVVKGNRGKAAAQMVEAPRLVAAPLPPPRPAPPPPPAAVVAEPPVIPAPSTVIDPTPPSPTEELVEQTASSVTRKGGPAGARRALLRSARPLVRPPGAIARRKGPAATSRSAVVSSAQAPAPAAKEEGWVDPFSNDTWNQPGSEK